MSLESLPIAKFRLGRIVTTPGAQSRMSHEDIVEGIRRHQAGNWGEVPPANWPANEYALKTGRRLFSAYRSAGGELFYIITEGDRSSTTVLLPDEY